MTVKVHLGSVIVSVQRKHRDQNKRLVFDDICITIFWHTKIVKQQIRIRNSCEESSAFLIIMYVLSQKYPHFRSSDLCRYNICNYTHYSTNLLIAHMNRSILNRLKFSLKNQITPESDPYGGRRFQSAVDRH